MERSKKIIAVDASVVVKWFVEEDHSKKALQIADDYSNGLVDLCSTQLMPYEVLNALRYDREMGESEVAKAGDSLERFQIALYPLLGELKSMSVRTAFNLGISIYDASYISLSQLLGKELFTADSKLLAKAKEHDSINHVSDYKS